MTLPAFLQPYLASYDLSRLDRERDKRLIITEVLNKGDFRALSWIGKTYTKEEVRAVVASPMRGMWFRQNLHYWMTIFSLKIPKDVYELALIDLRPRPHLYEKFFKLTVSS